MIVCEGAFGLFFDFGVGELERFDEVALHGGGSGFFVEAGEVVAVEAAGEVGADEGVVNVVEVRRHRGRGRARGHVFDLGVLVLIVGFGERRFKVRCNVELGFRAQKCAGSFGDEFGGAFGGGEGACFGVCSFSGESTARSWGVLVGVLRANMGVLTSRSDELLLRHDGGDFALAAFSSCAGAILVL